MTRKAEHNYQCLHCKKDLICPNCKSLRPMGTAFSLWLRQLPYPLNSQNYYTTDLDYIWWNYREGWFITIEEKQYSAKVPREQQEIINITQERLGKAGNLEQTTLRGDRVVRYKGHYNIIFEKTSPLDSEWIIVNGHSVSLSNIKYLLRAGELPKITTCQKQEAGIRQYIIDNLGNDGLPSKMSKIKQAIESGELKYSGEITMGQIFNWSK